MDERWEKGQNILKQLIGATSFPALDQLREFCPDFAQMIIAHGFGELYGRPGLDLKQRELVSLAALIAQGAVEQLRFHVPAALRAGLTPQEIQEVVMQCAGYVGYPRAISAMQMVMEILQGEN